MLPECIHASGKRRPRYFSDLAKQCIQSIYSLRNSSVDSTDVLVNGDLSHLRVRLTEYSEVLDFLLYFIIYVLI